MEWLAFTLGMLVLGLVGFLLGREFGWFDAMRTVDLILSRALEKEELRKEYTWQK